LYPRHRLQYLRYNLQLHHKRASHGVGIPLYFIETLIRVVPVIAVLATVNEPETGVVCDGALLHTNSPASLKSPSLL
jgi:hypothetical protein